MLCLLTVEGSRADKREELSHPVLSPINYVHTQLICIVTKGNVLVEAEKSGCLNFFLNEIWLILHIFAFFTCKHQLSISCWTDEQMVCGPTWRVKHWNFTQTGSESQPWSLSGSFSGISLHLLTWSHSRSSPRWAGPTAASPQQDLPWLWKTNKY